MSNDTFTIYDENDSLEAKKFCKDFLATPVGKRFLQLYDSNSAQDAWDGIIAKFRKIYGDDPITFGDLQSFVGDLLLSGGLRAPEPPAPAEKKLSSSQLAWQEFRVFSETHSMNECRARAVSDPGYASFMRLNTERELAEHQNPATDPISLNANKTPTTKFVSAELQRFCEDYRSMPMDKVRKLSSPATNPAGRTGADHFNSLLNKAIELALV
jgi:hypothetical protein